MRQSNPFSKRSSLAKRRYNNRATKRRLTRWRTGNRERARFLRKLDEFRSRLSPKAKDTLVWSEWKIKLQMAYNKCSYCQKEFKKLEIDHIVPLSKGGDNTLDNVTPCCRRCNASKGSKLLSEWTLGAANVETDAGLSGALPKPDMTTEIKDQICQKIEFAAIVTPQELNPVAVPEVLD